MGKRIAIIGGGVAGLTAGYLLDRKHQVTLFEKTDRIGGNAYTYTTRSGEDVDIAVAAFGKAGYPTFYRLLKELGVKTRPCLSAYMSFLNLDTGRGIYMTPKLAGLIAQGFKILGPKQVKTMLRLLQGVKRAQRLLVEGELTGLNMAEGFHKVPELRSDAWIIFMGALCLLSSMSATEILEAPASFFIHKLATHNDVISARAVYSVRAVQGRTRAYVDALAAPLGNRIVLDADIQTIERGESGVSIVLGDGTRRAFDEVVLACPADQALDLLAKPSADETRLLGAWRYKDGRMVLHRDHSSFPGWHLQQAYTFLYTFRNCVLETSVNGALRFEPGVHNKCDLISSQHPNFPIADDKIEYETVLRTPIFDFAACATIDDLPSLNGSANTWYCGSHFGHGLHEDAVFSATEVAAGLGVPF